MKRVSVIIPAWQAAHTIGLTLASLFAQTFSEIEVIIVDDASTDDLQRAIALWRTRVRYIRLERNGGAPRARNEGFRQATGEYVLFSDADLLWQPRAIALMVSALETHPEASYAYGSFRWGMIPFVGGPFDGEALQRKNSIHTAALIRRSAEPHFDESLKRFQDWDLWLTFLEQGKVGVFVPETLFRAVPRGSLGISSWRPSFWYRLPWERLGFIPPSVATYRAASQIIRNKHHLPDAPV